MTKPTASLRQVSLFGGVTDTDVLAISERCNWRRCDRKETIITRLDPSKNIYFVIEGRIRATAFSLSGREVAYREISAGSFFGELAAIDGKPRSADVIAVEPSLIAWLSAPELWRVLEQYPPVAAELLKHLSLQVRSLTERIFEFSTLAVQQRLHAELLRLAQPSDDGSSGVIAPAPSHHELATRISTHREAITRELNRLSRAGVLERRGREYFISDLPALERLVSAVLGDDDYEE